MIIIDQSPCYPFLAKNLKELFSIQFLSILKRIIYFVLTSLCSDLQILMNINFSQYEIYESFDYNPPKDIRGIFLDLSKAFDRVQHDRLIYKIKHISITGNSLKLIESFLSNRFQQVVLNGQSSSWKPVCAGVPQGSILGLLFFLIYINDLSRDICSTVKLFANDTSIFSVVDDVNVSVVQLNNDLLKISKWAYQ